MLERPPPKALDRAPGEALRLFVSYAPQDQRWYRTLRCWLLPLEQQGLLSIYGADEAGLAGDSINAPIGERDRAEIQRADLYLMLLSMDLIAHHGFTPFLAQARGRAESGEARCLMLILRPILSGVVSCAEEDHLLPPDRALSEWPDQDQAFKAVTEALRRVILSRSAGAFTPMGS